VVTATATQSATAGTSETTPVVTITDVTAADPGVTATHYLQLDLSVHEPHNVFSTPCARYGGYIEVKEVFSGVGAVYLTDGVDYTLIDSRFIAAAADARLAAAQGTPGTADYHEHYNAMNGEDMSLTFVGVALPTAGRCVATTQYVPVPEKLGNDY
jgi:hypothetical protein